MAQFTIQFEDPIPEVVGGAKFKPNWQTGGGGRVVASKTGLSLEGPSRYSPIERLLSAGAMQKVIFGSFFETIRNRTRDLKAGDIQRVVAGTKPNPTTLRNDIIHVFVEKADGTQDIHCFGFSTMPRPALWLFWGFLTRILPSEKLDLQPEELKNEAHLEGHSWGEEEVQSGIATAFFGALPLVEDRQGELYELENLANLYEELFGAAGRPVSTRMLSAEDWRIRATAASCLARTGEASDVDAVLPLLKDTDSRVRVATAKALVSFPADTVDKALQVASQDEDGSVRRAAQKALKTIAKR